jgi:hypothetical protein
MPVEGDGGGGAAVEVEPEGEECRWRVTGEEGAVVEVASLEKEAEGKWRAVVTSWLMAVMLKPDPLAKLRPYPKMNDTLIHI